MPSGKLDDQASPDSRRPYVSDFMHGLGYPCTVPSSWTPPQSATSPGADKTSSARTPQADVDSTTPPPVTSTSTTELPHKRLFVERACLAVGDVHLQHNAAAHPVVRNGVPRTISALSFTFADVAAYNPRTPVAKRPTAAAKHDAVPSNDDTNTPSPNLSAADDGPIGTSVGSSKGDLSKQKADLVEEEEVEEEEVEEEEVEEEDVEEEEVEEEEVEEVKEVEEAKEVEEIEGFEEIEDFEEIEAVDAEDMDLAKDICKIVEEAKDMYGFVILNKRV